MPTEKEVLETIERLRKECEPQGQSLNPNKEDLRLIIEGYLENQERFGYPACPCRLASGDPEGDRDIVCPCDYRDADVAEFGGCYCSLYVDEQVARGERRLGSIPERRLPEGERKRGAIRGTVTKVGGFGVAMNVWRCPVCGYLCAKDQPPLKCPICGAKGERFELFMEPG